MNLFIVRHGESEGNASGVHQTENSNLSIKGRAQALELSKMFTGVSISKIYSSTMDRAAQTAEIINQLLNVEIVHTEYLKEQIRPTKIIGLEFSSPEAAKIRAETTENRLDPNWRFEDGESFNDLLNRVRNFSTLLKYEPENASIICVSHVKTIILLTLHLIFAEKLTPEIYFQFYDHVRLQNTGVTELKYTDNFGWTMIHWNDTSHL